MKYIKKLGQQELGYRNGKQTTGGYFYISKSAVSFFPKLDKDIHNDHTTIEIRVNYREKPIFLNFVFHNDKYNNHLGTRNEYRIYLTRDVAPDDFFFKPNDIVVFEKLEANVFLLEKFSFGDNEYNKLNEIIIKSKIKGFHALID